MIGSKRLQDIAQRAQSHGWHNGCLGEFVLAAQEELYGSGISTLSSDEMEEVLAFVGQLRGSYGAPAASVDSQPDGATNDRLLVSRSVEPPHERSSGVISQ
jgi:hypothetical protein